MRASLARAMPLRRRAALVPLAALLAAAALLLLADLGGPWLWEDESDTALFARSIVRHGLPLAWDGRSFVDSDDGLRVVPQRARAAARDGRDAVASLLRRGGELRAVRRIGVEPRACPLRSPRSPRVAALYALVLRTTGCVRSAFAAGLLLLASTPVPALRARGTELRAEHAAHAARARRLPAPRRAAARSLARRRGRAALSRADPPRRARARRLRRRLAAAPGASPPLRAAAGARAVGDGRRRCPGSRSRGPRRGPTGPRSRARRHCCRASASSGSSRWSRSPGSAGRSASPSSGAGWRTASAGCSRCALPGSRPGSC